MDLVGGFCTAKPVETGSSLASLFYSRAPIKPQIRDIRSSIFHFLHLGESRMIDTGQKVCDGLNLLRFLVSIPLTAESCMKPRSTSNLTSAEHGPAVAAGVGRCKGD